MKLQISVLVALAATVAAAYPKIAADSVRMSQSGNRTATITYTLENEDAVVTLDIEAKDADGAWKSIGNPLAHATGDCWRRVAPGSRKITWRARRDWPDQKFDDASVRAVVTAWPLCSPPDYMVVDLESFTQTFYPSVAFLPGGLADRAYRTTKLVMRKIPAEGVTFSMGQPTDSEVQAAAVRCFLPAAATPHLVSFSNDYYMAIYETTQKQNQLLRGDADSNSCDRHDEKPVDGVSYNMLRGTDAAVGGILLKMRANSGLPFDLPTEAEWEYACRAGTTAAYSNGEDFSNTEVGCLHLEDVAWYSRNRPAPEDLKTQSPAYYGGLHIVGEKQPNAWGLYDMHGNASEWCRDYAVEYVTEGQPLLNPAYSTGLGPVKRGGNWYVAGVYAASSARRYTTHGDYACDAFYGANVWANGYRLVCPVVVK